MQTTASRSRPRGTIQFNPPITGPSGASLIAYTWQWKPFEFVDATGEERVGRMSDWEKSEINPETGREIVHQFHVLQPDAPDGVTVSAESALALLGYLKLSEAPTFKAVANAAKSLARLQMQLAETLACEAAFDADLKRILLLPTPSPETTDVIRFGKPMWKMGDATRIASAEGLSRQDLTMLRSEWIENRLRDAGWKSGVSGHVYTADAEYRNHNPFSVKASDLNMRIKKAQQKVDSIAQNQISDDEPTTNRHTAPRG